MPVTRIAIAGFGNVGRAIAQLLLTRRDRYARLYGHEVRLVAVCGSKVGVANEEGLNTDQLGQLEPGNSGPDFLRANNPDILIEAGPSDFRTGGPGLSYLRAMLTDGRDVIVVSKGALVYDGRALRALADASGAALKISGATAAALPTIDLLQYNLAGSAVVGLEGILNATTNYLLDAMITRGVGLDAALAEAQAGGFAERDPRNDIEGWDTACKLLLLANFGMGADLSIADLPVQGIQAVTQREIAAWRAAGVVPRLVGSLTRDGDKMNASVEVRTYRADDPFALVKGKTKAIRIATDAMGEIIAIGGGPEPGATAAAALKDLEHLLMSRPSAGSQERS